MDKMNVPYEVSRLLGGRPVRWANSVGDYDGRERTLEVFNADLSDQRSLLSSIFRDKRLEVFGPFVVIFHSVKQTQERYASFLNAWEDICAVASEMAVEGLYVDFVLDAIAYALVYEGGRDLMLLWHDALVAGDTREREAIVEDLKKLVSEWKKKG